jgi:DNA-binding response OmpR family regulator
MVMTTPFIMLVDDENSFVETMAKRLGKRNIETLKAFSGEESLEILKTHQNIDVVVLDVKMPGMDGIETLKRIKMDFPLVEVIMLSGHATIESAIGGLKLGAFDYLTKPCDMGVLVDKVGKATKKKRAHEEKMHDWERYMGGNTLKELMVPIEKYATVTEDANVLEAINALENAQKAFDSKRYRHRAVLVLDQEKRVVGKLNQHDLIQALEPNFLKLEKEGQQSLGRFGVSDFFVKSAMQDYRLWEKPIENLFKKATEQQIKHIMYLPKEEEYIEIDATMDEAIHRLIIGQHHSLIVRNQGNIVGILRLTDVFEHIHFRLKTFHLAEKETVKR